MKEIAAPRKSSKHKITYTVTLDCPLGANYFFIPQDLIIPVGANGKKQRGPALGLTTNGLRFYLFLHDEFSLQQSSDESLKKGQDGRGVVQLNSAKAKDMLRFRNFYRYVALLENRDLLERNGYSNDGEPKYLLINPYFEKRKHSLPTDLPQIVIDEVRTRHLIGQAEALDLIISKDRHAVEELIMGYGFDWVEDALYTISLRRKSDNFKTVETIKGILVNWIENGKVIGFHDDHIKDLENRETEELANLFMGRRPRMLEQHEDLKDAVNFFDKHFVGSKQTGFPLLIEDFPGGMAYYDARTALKQRFLVPRYFNDKFNSLCDTYSLKWVADAYSTVRGNWPSAEASYRKQKSSASLSTG